ncbi:hypothetical protein [Ideonella sp. YS5]|uniref:hypothetical protein n=1 Tax=Ideonella sp. YS5 TaxID=3453714 RepID=UPI003F709C7C
MSGKQRMLSLRALKAYAQLSLNVMPEKAAPILAASLDELKSSNATLRTLAKDANLAALQSQATLIDKLAAVTRTPPSAGTVQQAAQVSEELLANAEAVTQGFVKSGAEAPAALVNLAARQRMLSQRAAGSYFAYQAAAKSPELKARALKATADFKAAISAFDDAKAEFPQIADRLEMARMQMIFFDNALGSIDSPTKEQFATIATTSERILSEMDSMTSEIIKQLAARSAVAPMVVSKK